MISSEGSPRATVEPIVASIMPHFEALGYRTEYEELRGAKRPDITLYGSAGTVVAVIEVETIAHTNKELARIARGESISEPRDPHVALRNKINKAREQFEGSEDYPCIMLVKDGKSGINPPPLIIAASMLGDLTVIFNPSQPTTQLAFGKRGRMLKPHHFTAQNTTVSAIGTVSVTFPDRHKSGYDEKVAELLERNPILDRASHERFSEAERGLRWSLTQAGYDLGLAESAITYVENPFATHPLPHKITGLYDEVYRYMLQTGNLVKVKSSNDSSHTRSS